MPDDYTSDTQTTGAVAVGGSAAGEIETSNDFDWFAVDLVAGHTYVIGLEGADSGGGALQDPVLRGLYDAGGNRIAGARDNDGGAGRDARLTFTAATTGAYYIEARGHSNQTGEYTVRVTEWVDTDAERGGATDLGDITALAGLQFPAASLDGSSDSVDYWRFTLSEARRVGLGLRQQDANADLFLEDAEGNVLYSGTEEGTASEWISQTLLAGTYFVRVEAQEEGANEFKLRYGVSGANPDVVAALEQQQQEGTDEAPEFAEASYAFSLAENADGGTDRVSLGAVTATDPDNDTVAYSIEGGNESGSFEIDAASGELFYVGAGEDYEAGAAQFDLTIRASDGALTADAAVSVAITDVPEQTIVAPADPENLQSVSEPYGEDLPTNTSTIGRVAVGGTATGKIGSTGDRDGFAVELVAGRTYIIDLRGSPTGDGTLNDPYLRGIKGPDGSRIAGVSNDDGGEGYNSRLNFTPTESGTHYIIAGAYSGLGAYEVEVRDVSPQTAQQKTVNGPPAFGQTSYAFSLAENADGGANGVSLGAVSATDPEDAAVSYSIEAGDSGGLFEIDATSGEVFYIGVGEDYESGTTSYELTVRAGDGSLHSDVTVAVNVTDVAEAPAFAETSYAFDLAENADGGASSVALGAVSATDPENSTITYSIEAGDSGGLFEIDSGTGALSYQGAGEDYESGTTSYELTVRASDGSLHSEVTVTVNVTDVAEAPAFAEGSYAFSLAENADGGAASVALGAVSATDPENSTITYSIEAGDSGGLFAIDPGTGALSYQGAGEDYESGTTRYELTVRASDGSLHSEVTVTVNVTDVAEAQEVTETQQSVSEPDGQDLPEDTSTTGRVAVGGSATGKIHVFNDHDWFAVELEAGSTYRIDLEGSWTGGGTMRNPHLGSVRDADGVRILYTWDDDGGAGYNARVTFTATDAGTYYLVAGNSYVYTGGGEYDSKGTYTLSVTEVPDDLAAGTGTSGAVEVGGSVTSDIEISFDCDWFAVELEAGATYRIDLKGSPTGSGTLSDPYLYGLHDADGNFIPGTTDDDGGAGYNARVTFTAEEAGAYYVAAGAWGYDTGTYTLSVVEDSM